MLINWLKRTESFITDYSFITGEFCSIDSVTDTVCMVHYNYKTLIRGYKQYELSNHLGNVLTVISDKRITLCDSIFVKGYDADVVRATDYYAFGSPMLERTFSSNSYRYGFNGKEKTDEINGEGVVYDYGFRIYESRLGRFLSIDPLKNSYPYFTPFQFSGNNPIVFIDLDGLEQKKPEVRTNILIVIDNANAVRKRVQNGTSTFPMGTFQIIYASSISDANTKLSNYMLKNKLEKIDNLVIRTHGNHNYGGGNLDLDPSSSEVVDAVDVAKYKDNPTNDQDENCDGGLSNDKFEQIKALDEMADKVKDGGNLVITSCWGGDGINGVSLAEELQGLTDNKVNIYLNKDKSTRDYPPTNPGGGLTTQDNIDKGWIKAPAGGGKVVELKDSSNGKSENIKVDTTTKGKNNPIKEL